MWLKIMNKSFFQEIADLIADLPLEDNERGRRAFMLKAGLDDTLIKEIDFSGAAAAFWPLCVEKLGQHGETALIAVLTEAQKRVGSPKKAQCAALIEQARTAAAQIAAFDAATPEYQRYKAAMEKQHGAMNILSMTKPMPLEGFFTQVNLLSKPAASRRYPNGFDDLQAIFLGNATFSEKIEKGQDGLQAVREHRRLFILGKPGAGKTTFLKYVMLTTLAGKLDSDVSRIPILICLRDLRGLNAPLFDVIARQFECYGFPDARRSVAAHLQAGRGLVLFDGLDEVNADQAERERVIRAIEAFSQEFDQSRIVITCRVAAEEYHFTDFTYVEMADFEPAQVRSFVRHWFETTQNAETRLLGTPEEHAARFFAEFEKNERLRDLAKSPLLLTLLCIGFEEAQTFPDRRSEIYQEALDVLLRRWDKSRGISRDPRYQRLSLARKHQMFARIAAETFERGEYLWPLDRLARLVADYMRNIPQIDPQEEIHGADVVKTIEEQHGVFVERAHAVYSFAHLTFQEYYTAQYIVSHLTQRELLACHLPDERWEEVFFLTAEMLPDNEADKFFECWLNALDDMARQSPRLTRLLKLVETQAPAIRLDENTTEERRVAFANYTPLQRRAVMMLMRIRTAEAIEMSMDSYNADAGYKLYLSDDFTDIISIIIPNTNIDYNFDTSYAVVQAILSATYINYDSLVKSLGFAIKHSTTEGLKELSAALLTLRLPKNKNDTKALGGEVFSQLLTIFRTHFPSAEYELTWEEIEQIRPYLNSTALLLRCLRNAYVSDRAAIEDRLLRSPSPAA